MSLADPLILTIDPDLGAHRRHGRSLDILTQIVGIAGVAHIGIRDRVAAGHERFLGIPPVTRSRCFL